MESTFTHIDAEGNVTMVDVGNKDVTLRRALAEAWVELAPKTATLLRNKALPKGDALACAKVGGILAAKQTSALIPLCHNINLTYADVKFDMVGDRLHIVAETRSKSETGVEMEAIVAAQTAAAIIYDMCKAVQRDIVISRVRLLYKNGGKSGEFIARDIPQGII